jgi:hypothetical protein
LGTVFREGLRLEREGEEEEKRLMAEEPEVRDAFDERDLVAGEDREE